MFVHREILFVVFISFFCFSMKKCVKKREKRNKKQISLLSTWCSCFWRLECVFWDFFFIFTIPGEEIIRKTLYHNRRTSSLSCRIGANCEWRHGSTVISSPTGHLISYVFVYRISLKKKPVLLFLHLKILIEKH